MQYLSAEDGFPRGEQPKWRSIELKTALLTHESPDRATDSLLIDGMYREPSVPESTSTGSEEWRSLLRSKRVGCHPDAIGSIGRYDVLAHLASGGMGIVLKAYEPAADRLVAIKLLAPEWAVSELPRRRFLREARAAAALEHPNIMPIYDVNDVGETPFLVMPFNDGPTLQAYVQEQGPLEPEVIRVIAKQIASGLEASAANGIVHRDLKPPNILLEVQDPLRVRIADFGLAQAKDMPELTIPGTLPGTPQFMAPEQIEGKAVDHRADLFALGGLLHFMASGEPPFQGSQVSRYPTSRHYSTSLTDRALPTQLALAFDRAALGQGSRTSPGVCDGGQCLFAKRASRSAEYPPHSSLYFPATDDSGAQDRCRCCRYPVARCFRRYLSSREGHTKPESDSIVRESHTE